MPNLTRLYCSSCQQSIYNCIIEGVRVPLVLYFVVGQPSDTGPPLGISDPGVKLPSFVREMMQVPVPRAELCMACVSLIFGVPLLTADDDPMFSTEQAEDTATAVRAVVEDPEMDDVNKAGAIMERPLLAFKVGRGEVEAPALPPVRESAVR